MSCSMATQLRDTGLIALSALCGSGAAWMFWNYVTRKDTQTNGSRTEIKQINTNHHCEEKNHLFRYIDEFLSLKCATDLMGHNIYPNCKEITESFSVLHALRKYLNASSKNVEKHKKYHFENSDVTAIVVGDGTTPRIASLLCYITKWDNVYSVDPQLRIKKNKSWKHIQHLTCLQSKIEDITIKINDNHNVIVVFMHSHVLLEESLSSICFSNRNNKGNEMCVVTVPCCQFMQKHKTLYGQQPDHTFEDISMASSKNTFYIWKDLKCTPQ
eukprot:779604_1